MSVLRPRLLAVWVTFVVLVAAILIVERSERAEQQAPLGPDPRAFLSVPLAELSAIEVGRAGGVHRFERDREGSWYHHDPHGHTHDSSSKTARHTHTHGKTRHTHDAGKEPQAPAQNPQEHRADPVQAERIASTFAALERARMERTFPLQGDGKEYGLVSPSMVIVVYRGEESQPLAQYAVGDLAPDSLSRYVLKVGSSEVFTLPDYQIENLGKLIESMRK